MEASIVIHTVQVFMEATTETNDKGQVRAGSRYVITALDLGPGQLGPQ